MDALTFLIDYIGLLGHGLLGFLGHVFFVIFVHGFIGLLGHGFLVLLVHGLIGLRLWVPWPLRS